MDDEEEDNVESLGVRNFIASRIYEIKSLSHQISTTGIPSIKGLAFQHVPKHMRRRAVSHNPKRLPKRLQAIHKSQMEKCSGQSSSKKPKKPSRKYRRRPSNLLQEYNRRQREHKWLETHIWHAKRFHMSNKWGYRMPIEPTGKGYRAGYRAASKFCAMRDISFYSCLQIDGDFELISTTISTAFIPKDVNPLSLSSEMYKSGKREGTLYFYQSHAYPFGYVGKVRFYWNMNDSSSPSLFLWVHPSQKEEILKQLLTEFELISKQHLVFSTTKKKEEDEKLLVFVEAEDESKKDDERMDTSPSSDENIIIGQKKQQQEHKNKSTLKNVDSEKLLSKKLNDRPKWINYSTNIEITDLEGVFNRFRLYGPLSTQTLKEVLNVLSLKMLKNYNNTNKSFWWLNYYLERTNILDKQCELWTKFRDFSQVPCHSIIPLTVNDPRISIPNKVDPVMKTMKPSCKHDNDDGDDLGNIVDELQTASTNYPLLDEVIRMKAINEKMSQEEFNKRQSQLLIPGSKLNLGVEENQVPILLIHRPNNNTGCGCRGFKNEGWDLILPAVWAMPFWISLVYRSVRIVGLRESETFECESGSSLNSSEDGFFSPDSMPGQTESEMQSNDLRTNYFKYPPAKRSSFIKLGCPFPFQISWKILLNFNNNVDVDPIPDSPFYILRNPTLLRNLKDKFKKQQNVDTTDENESLFLEQLPNSENVLIEIRLTIIGKGSISTGAVICIPQESDIIAAHQLPTNNLEEPIGNDAEAQQKRQELKNGRDRMKSFMQKKRQKLRKQQSNNNNGTTVAKNKLPEVDLSLYSSDRLTIINEAINSLWLPNSEQVLKQMTRTPIGFIIFGRETYSIAKCSGIGYCTLTGLKQWFKCAVNYEWNPKKLILVRDCRNSLVYRFAKLEICVKN